MRYHPRYHSNCDARRHSWNLSTPMPSRSNHGEVLFTAHAIFFLPTRKLQTSKVLQWLAPSAISLPSNSRVLFVKVFPIHLNNLFYHIFLPLSIVFFAFFNSFLQAGKLFSSSDFSRTQSLRDNQQKAGGEFYILSCKKLKKSLEKPKPVCYNNGKG